MIKNPQNKEFVFKNTINRKAEKFGEKVFSSPEVLKTEERNTEQTAEKTDSESGIDRQTDKEKILTGSAANLTIQQTTDNVRSEIKNIENILQEGLGEIYKTMDPISQAQFKAQGEDTARAINILLHKTKIKIKEIVDLIIKWLKLIPGVNKFFVEQEAKIKADKLMAQKRKRDEENLKS